MNPFIGPSYQLNVRSADVQRSVNLYPCPIESGSGNNAWMLRSVPGRTVFSAGSGEGRGCFETAGRAFIVIGNTLYEVGADGSRTSRGTLATTTGPVDFAANMTQVCIVDGPCGYILTKDTNAFAQITDPDFPGSQRVNYLGQYFIFSNPASKTGAYYISDLGDGSAVDALDFQSAESQPDPLVAHVVVGENLWLLGSQSSEVHVVTGASTFPIERVNGATSRTGCIAPFSLVNINNTAMWLGSDLIVWQTNGYQPARVSNRAVEEAIARCTDPASAFAWTWTWRGSVFYALTLPGVSTTWVLDLTANHWHEEGEFADGVFLSSAVVGYMYAHGKPLVLGSTGSVYELRDDVYDLAGDVLCRTRVSPHMATEDGNWHVLSGVTLMLDRGTGGQAMLRVSKDGGGSYGGWKPRSLGATGRLMKQVRWDGLGGGKDLVIEVRCTDAVAFNLVNADINAS
jgi:hypothetical protein